MVFGGGSQATKWMFTKEQLLEKRAQANKKCKAQLKVYNKDLDMSMCITEEEEGTVVDAFLNMIRPFYRKFSPPLPMQVYGVSVTYFRRFFLKYSVMDFHPREIIVACIYVACKITEFSISMDTFLKNIPKNSEKYHSFIYNSEMFLIDELNYDLWVYTPYEPFKAFMVELKAFQLDGLLASEEPHNFNNNRLKYLSENESFRDHIKTGINIINDWYESDLMMMFSPDHIALAAVEASTSTNHVVFKDFVMRKVADNKESRFNDILSTLDQIKTFIQQEFIVHTLESLKVYEQRVDMYRNPKFNVQSDIYQEFKQKYDEKYSGFD